MTDQDAALGSVARVFGGDDQKTMSTLGDALTSVAFGGKIAYRFTPKNNTFGIEVEFCGHEDDYLSFTHVVPCWLAEVERCPECYKEHEYKWEIETDSDHTLEFVTPILYFETAEAANYFKISLRSALHTLAVAKLPLGECLTAIAEFIAAKTAFFMYFNVDHRRSVQSSGGLLIQYADDLRSQLTVNNWDDTTPVRPVEALRNYTGLVTRQEHTTQLRNVVISRATKHLGQYPSSQLNTLMTLKDYVGYLVNGKELNAWRRLLLIRNDDFLSERAAHWGECRLAFEEKEPQEYWSHYKREKPVSWITNWFWLVTFRELTEVALGQEASQLSCKIAWLNDVKEYKAMNKLGRHQNKTGLVESITKAHMLAAMSDMQQQQYRLAWALLYLTVQKLIGGAFGVLGETAQLRYQHEICGSTKFFLSTDAAEKEKIKSDLCERIEYGEFKEMHSFVKDLTPLWFKGWLFDVYQGVREPEIREQEVGEQEVGKDGQESILLCLNEQIQQLNKDMIEKIIRANIALLREELDVNTFRSWCGAGNPIFETRNKKARGSFYAQYEIGQKALSRTLNEFIKGNRPYKIPDIPDKFLERANCPPWEARCDTLKPRMDGKFLVEHRND